MKPPSSSAAVPITATTFWPGVNCWKVVRVAVHRPLEHLAHQTCIRMISVNASTALLRTATVTWVVTAAWVAAIV